MLKKILNGKVCAKCKLCCGFDKSDVWEMPVFTEEIRDRIRSMKPETEFEIKADGYRFCTGEIDDNQLIYCPALTENGCILGDDKPFDCRIWPFRIMDIQGKRAITIASICEELYNRPLAELVKFLEDGLAETIFSYADSHPEIIKPYYDGYPVLMFEK